ncbi:VCBS repeat-containing protein [Bradyrhizobium sp. AZCC 1721]
MRSFYEDSGLGRIALGLRTWPRTVLRGNARAPDLDTDSESLLAARKWWEGPGMIGLGAVASTFTEIAEARFAGLTAEVRVPAPAAAEPAMSDPVVLLGRVPSAPLAPTIIGSSAPPPAAAAICGCGYFLAPTQVLDQIAAHTAHVRLSGQVNDSRVSGGADFLLTGQAGIMGASVSAEMSLQNVAPIKDWALVGGQADPGPGSGQGGVLSGSVTTATASSATTTASPNVVAAAAAASTNAIVLENQKQGTPQSVWDIDGAGSSNIEGFATDISVDNGNRVDFKINTNSSNYRIEIYRLGYYGGMGARLVTTIQHTGVQNQPAPLRDATTGLVDAGNWSVSASWDIPADAVSGVYIAKLVRQDGTFGENHIPFIVRDDSSTSDIIFQTSDTTWQAYNGWGGANFYGGNGPATGQGAGRAYAVSYNRPIATRGGIGQAAGPQDYLFGAEYSAIYWLEQNGYDVSYMAGVDTDRYGSLLLNHKMYLDVGHDEYWSGQQRDNVQAARDAGVNLSFWSGNEMYWRTRWGNSISSDGTAYRTLISYKETWANSSIDPTNQWTGTFRDPRFSPPATGGGIPENALIGQLFQVDDVGVTQPDALKAITIPYDDANLRFWRNTSVANLQQGQTATLTKNYLGYEWDEAPDNGFDPAGLVRLSSTTLPVSTYLLDYGNTVGAGVSTHNLTLYRAPSGALVFGAGTVYWSWGLSDNHDLQPTPSDPRVQQAMVNLLADMGIQPGTLQSGLVPTTASTDTTAPTSTINPIASFTAQSVVTISGTASDLGGGVIGAVEVSTDGGVTWYNAIGDENWTYTWSPQVAGTYTIKSRAVDDSINLETPSAGRTVVVSAPSYITLFSGSATPAIVNVTDASAVELGVKFQSSVAGTVSGIRFYKGSQDTGTHTGELWSSTGTLLATATFTNETASGWQSVTFSNPVTLTPNTTYVASYHTNVGHYSVSPDYFTSNVTSGPLTAFANGNGVYVYSSNRAFPTNTYSGENYWVDVMFNPSTVNGVPVAANDVGPTIAQNLAATIAASSLISNDSDPDGDALSVIGVSAPTHGTVVLNTQPNPQNNTITFTPDSGYTGPASFSYTISDGRGGTATAQVSFTVAPPGAAPVSLFSASNIPAQTSLNDGQQLEVGVKFTSSVAGQITALKFYRSASDTGADVVDLWTSTGTLLASATFTNTAASGWQTVNLSSAVSIAANTTYVASYHTTGAYVATNNYFTTAVTNGPLTAPSTTTVAGGNGVYSYGGTSTTGIFPTNTYGAANYWVDVVFSPSGTSNIAPTAVADSGDATEKGGPNNGTGGSAATGNVLANDTDPDAGDTKTVSAVSFGATAGTLGTALAGAYGSLVLNASGAYTYTVNETASAVQALRLSTNTLTEVFNYTMRDAAGATSSTTLTVTIHGANDAPVLAVQTSDQSASVGSAFSLTLPAGTFTDVDSGDTLTYAATALDGAALPAWLTFNGATRSFSGTPTSTGTVGVRVSVTDAGGLTTSETFNIVVMSTPNTPPTAVADTGDATERGGTNNATGGSVATGNVLTNDTDENAGDTKTVSAVSFGATAGTLGTALAGAYGSLVLNASGVYTYTVNETASAVQALRLSTNTLTEVFNYTMRDAAGATSSTTLTVTIHGANDAPVLAVQTGDQNTTVGSTFSLTLPAGTFADVDSGDTLTYAATALDGSALPAWLTFDGVTRTFSGTPTSTGTVGVRVSVTDAGGLTTNETFNIVVTPLTVSLFSSSDTPAILSDPDTAQVNLGVRFTSSSAGTITGIKYYKGANDTGTHTGSLWSSTGTLLATATFTNETASGWQTVTFSNPVAIDAGTTYVASYHSNGHYAATGNYFTTARVNGPLTAPASNNGVYVYGTGNLFPTSTYGAANYWVDVIFSPASSGTNQAPVASNDSGFNVTQNTPLSVAASSLLANDTDPDGDTLTITGAGSGVNGTASFNAQNNTVVFTPNSGYTGPASFTYAISDGRGGTANATASLTVNAASASIVSLFSSNPTPSLVSVNDPNSVELGLKFQASSTGDVTGLRFYKGASNTGTHVAHLWTSTGTLLATATFTNETASGWQQVDFATPVTITAGTTYVASYHTSGNYAADPGLFNSAVTNGPLTAPSSATSGGNGVYAYGSGALFPTNSYNSTSYGVDVLFRPQLVA